MTERRKAGFLSRHRPTTDQGAPHPAVFSLQTVFDYDRTVVAFHGTRQSVAKRLVAGEPFGASTNEDDWLGHGIYFWEYAPQQAWRWSRQRYGDEAAVVGALIRLGRCFDLLDPSNARVLRQAHDNLELTLRAAGLSMRKNMNSHKFLDCDVFKWMYTKLDVSGLVLESCRAVFVPMTRGRGGLPRLWKRSGLFEETHIQLCLREPSNIRAVWAVRKDGRYGKDREEEDV